MGSSSVLEYRLPLLNCSDILGKRYHQASGDDSVFPHWNCLEGNDIEQSSSWTIFPNNLLLTTCTHFFQPIHIGWKKHRKFTYKTMLWNFFLGFFFYQLFKFVYFLQILQFGLTAALSTIVLWHLCCFFPPSSLLIRVTTIRGKWTPFGNQTPGKQEHPALEYWEPLCQKWFLWPSIEISNQMVSGDCRMKAKCQQPW